LIPPILNENTHAKVKLPPISLPDNSLNNQVRQIEDTLKTFQQVGNIPNVSKEKILKDVWCVLNKSINEITDSNSGSFPLPLPLPLPHQKMGRVSQRQSFQLFNTNNNIENNVINGNLENSNTSSRSSSNSFNDINDINDINLASNNMYLNNYAKSNTFTSPHFKLPRYQFSNASLGPLIKSAHDRNISLPSIRNLDSGA
ncbi:hypothetical protein JL09_g5045, partial [Pichia kudriavzevii]